MPNNEKTGSPEERRARWITVRFKMLGIFSIMLALLVMFQAANYFLTLRSVQGLKEFYGKELERNEALGLKHLLYDKQLALDNYTLFPDETHMGQLLYADKTFVKRIDELRAQRKPSGGAGRVALLDRIKALDGSHNRALERLVRTYARGGPDKAVAAVMESVESIEKDMFSNIVMLSLGPGDEGLKKEKTAGWSRLADIPLSYFNPVVRAGLDIHVEAGELSDYIKIRDLVHQRVIASRRFLITGQQRYVEEFNNRGAELERSIEHAISFAKKSKDDGKGALENAKVSNGLVSAAFKKAVFTYRSGYRQNAAATILSAFLDQEMLSTTLDDLVDEERGHVASAFTALTPIMNYALSLSKVMFIYIMLVAGLMSVIIYAAVSRMVRPIINLDDAACKIAQGDWTQRVEVCSRDEIGMMARSFNKMTDNLQKAEAEILKNQLELSALYDVSRAIGRTIGLDQLLAEILDTITRIEIFGVERKGSIFTVEGGMLKLAAHLGYPPGLPDCHNENKIGDCLCGLAVKTSEIVVSKHSADDERHTVKFPEMSPHGHLIVPLKAMDKVVGVLCLYLPVGVDIEEDRKMLLYILGAQIGIAIDNARLYEETKRLSIRDPLTGLANRRLMDIMLEKSFARAKRLGSPFSCIMLDIDYFKKYNDTYGHPAGDSLLVKIAGILLDEVREIDTVVRYGGEEFFVLLPDVKSPEALRAAERIRLAVEAGTGVTVSLGISSYYREAEIKEDIVKKADEALYQAKQLGRNRIELNAA